MRRFTDGRRKHGACDVKIYGKRNVVHKIFEAAHTLKGLISNLGLDGIMRSISPITETLRAGSDEGVRELMEQAGKEYQIVVDILETI